MTIQSLCLVSLLVLLGHPSHIGAQWLNHIYVDPVNGSNTPACRVPNTPNQPACKNLSYALQYRNYSTQYQLYPGHHYLDNSTYGAPFTLNDVAITGISSDTVIECFRPNSGLTFIGATNVHLEKVTFLKCAALQNSTSRDFGAQNFALHQFKVALYFYLCQNVSMLSITVTNSSNATGVVMYDTTGTNTIENSTFAYNILKVYSVLKQPCKPPCKPPYAGPYPGGGGFYVEFTYCIPGDNSCTDSVASHVSANSNSTYKFHNCTFSDNWADNLDNGDTSTFIIPHHSNHEAFGRGGGLSIFLKGNASENTFHISECSFLHNTAIWGGGLLLEFHDSVGGNRVTINGSTFHRNNCSSSLSTGTAGGGMKIGHYVFGETAAHSIGNQITVKGCKFTRNSALNGGALSISPTLQNASDNQLASISVSRCHFEHNKARLGAAVHISRFSPIIEGKILKVTLEKTHITANSVARTKRIYLSGIGALYTNGVPVQFRNKIHFENNNGTALGVVGTHVDFMNSTVTFLSNSGYKGVAIALLGDASIVINESTSLVFTNNSAQVHGGAIYNKYIERDNLKTYANCFIHHKNPYLSPNDWGAVFSFTNNTAVLNGNSIHSTSIFPCARLGDFGVANVSGIFCWRNWTYNNGTNCAAEIGSEAGSITSNATDMVVEAIPGKTFLLPLQILDDLGHNLNNQTVFTATSNDTNTATIDPAFSFVSGETIRVTGKENSTFELLLHDAGESVWHVDFEIKLQSCPPGFKPSSNDSTVDARSSSRCICSGDYSKKVMCNPTAYESRLENSYWMGPSPEKDHEDELSVSLCVPGYCHTDPTKAFLTLPNSSSQLDAHICGSMNRTGTLCGECKKGYGPAINSETYECVYCNGTNIAAHATYYILSVYLPLFVLFTAIIVFNIRLTTGPANAFILYSQVVASTFDLNADSHIPLNLIMNHKNQMLKAYQVPYGVFNLEFFENFLPHLCLGTHLNTLDILQLNYLVALFPLVMILFVLVFVRVKYWVITRQWFRKIRMSSLKLPQLLSRQRIGKTLIHAFAAFLLLSYTKFSLASSYIVNLHPLYGENGKQVGSRRVYYAGQYSEHDSEYISRYFLPAIFIFTTFVAIPPLLLLDFPIRWFEKCVNKISWLRKFYPAGKVQILLDAFQGCYRNKMRFFAGIYFIFRLVINVSYILTDTWLQQFIVQQIACTLFIALIAICQPYTKKFLNYVDILIFTNLVVLNALSLYLYEYALNNPGQHLPLSAFVIQYILVFLPLFYMIGYICWYITKPHHHCLKQSKIALLMKCCERTQTKAHDQYQHSDRGTRADVSTTEVMVEELQDPVDEMEALLERSRDKNTYIPMIPHSQNLECKVDVHEEADSGQYTFTHDYGSTHSASGTN